MDCIPDTPDEGSASKAVHAAAFGATPGSSGGKVAGTGFNSPIDAAAPNAPATGAATAADRTAGAVKSRTDAGAAAAAAVPVDSRKLSSGLAANADAHANAAIAGAANANLAEAAQTGAGSTVADAGVGAIRLVAARHMVPESPDEVPRDTLSLPEAATQSQFSSTPAVLQEPKLADMRPAVHRQETLKSAESGLGMPNHASAAFKDPALASNQAKPITQVKASAPASAALMTEASHDVKSKHMPVVGAIADQHVCEPLLLELSPQKLSTTTTDQAVHQPMRQELHSAPVAAAIEKHHVPIPQQRKAQPPAETAAPMAHPAANIHAMQQQPVNLKAASTAASLPQATEGFSYSVPLLLENASAPAQGGSKVVAPCVNAADQPQNTPQMLGYAFANTPAGSKALATEFDLTDQQQHGAGTISGSPLNDSALMAALDSMERKACQVNTVGFLLNTGLSMLPTSVYTFKQVFLHGFLTAIRACQSCQRQ